MDKLTRQQEYVICKLLDNSRSEEITQYILEFIGRENWTRDILIEGGRFLTGEQEDILESLGDGYTIDEIDTYTNIALVNFKISEALRLQGAIRFLYENQDYIDAIRTGEIIVEGINVEQIKKLVVEEQQSASHTE